VQEADEAIHIGDNPASASYLNIYAIINAARHAGADAIHPGYGFLAENADFATACQKDGLVFIGPTPEAIRAMGNKREAKLLVQAAGVPIVPGYQGEDQRDATFIKAASKIGFPFMVKAAAGGGGKGIRVVTTPEALPEALAAARRESLSAFGDDSLLLERVISPARHIEFQIFGDQHGQVVHLGERECSIQRRHQKIIEETPSDALTKEQYEHMGQAAIIVGRAIGYTNAGTVEFLVDEAGKFYFLEINARLQVEHRITELVTGFVLVRWQIEVAEGQALPSPDEPFFSFTRYALECRVYAEDPDNGFLPATGDILLWRPPEGEGVRVDAGVQTGSTVSVYYDPMIAKIITYGPDRLVTLRRMDRALSQTILMGVRNNIAFLRSILFHPEYLAAHLSTSFLEQHFSGEPARPAVTPPALVAASLAHYLANASTGGHWRNNPNAPLTYLFKYEGDHELRCRLLPRREGRFLSVTTIAGIVDSQQVEVLDYRAPDLRLSLDGHIQSAVVVAAPEHRFWVQVAGVTSMLTWQSPLPEPDVRRDGAGSLRAPMPGTVRAVLAEPGQAVRKGEVLMLLEAMKMEHAIRAPYDGTVTSVAHQRGDLVQADAVLLEIEEKPKE
jgi:acetyl/propionyl-CoA carboxylase alpha subunit